MEARKSLGMCHICGKLATNTCHACGKMACDKDFDSRLGICMACKRGRVVSKV
ncbi:MAG: hypothetical protein KGI04_03050 [Candidatus Micrarchaeota archaeon]|nr:hypothetical protein [Candidatus Micrarchaeota archaeon]